MVRKGCADSFTVLLSVESDKAGKHSGDEDYNNNQEEHKVVVKVNNLLHNFSCGGLEVHLSGCSRIQNKSDEATFRCFTTENLAVGYTGRVDTSGVTLGYYVLNGKHI